MLSEPEYNKVQKNMLHYKADNLSTTIKDTFLFYILVCVYIIVHMVQQLFQIDLDKTSCHYNKQINKLHNYYNTLL